MIRRNQLIGIAIYLVIGILVPLVANSPRWITIGNLVFYYVILATSWNLIMGYTGIFSFGHMALAVVGGYTAALLVLKGGFPPVMSMLLGGLIAAFVSFILGIVCLRFKGFYLALVTWGFAEMILAVLNNEYKITGGSSGLSLVLQGLFMPGQGPLPYFYVGLGITLIFLVSTVLLMNSRIGVYLRSIRDNEDASEAMGVNTTFWKVFSFSLSGFWAGIAGTYYLNFMGTINPSVASTMELGNVILMVIVGGIGTVLGPVIGAIFVVIANQTLTGSLAGMSVLVFAVVMIITLRYFRGGMVGGLEKLVDVLRRNGKRHKLAIEEK